MGSTSLRVKMISSFVGVSVLTLVVGGVAIFTSERTAERYEHISNVNLPSNSSLSQMRGLAREALGLMLHLNLEGNTPEELARVETKLSKVYVTYEEVNKTLDGVDLGEEGEKQYQDVVAAWKTLASHIQGNTKLAMMSDSASRNKLRENYSGEFQKVRLDYFAKVDKLMGYLLEDSKVWVGEAQAYTAIARKLTIGFICAAFGLALAFGFFFSQSLSKTLMAIADTISAGSAEVAKASGSVSNSSESLSSSVAEQAAALQQTSSSIEELTQMVRKSSDNAAKSSEFATESHETATEGQRVVAEMINAMEEINHSNQDITGAIERSNNSISEIATVIAAIGEKTKVINEIVFQTRLLSFNASVEAARAGEHGKGFAVVAEEVGNLAQMSGNAAKEIGDMLSESTQKVATIVESTKKEVEALSTASTMKISQGKDIAVRCGEVLEKVVTDASSVNRLNSEIASASREQTTGITEITKAMHQLDQATQENSQASQTTASAAVELTEQANSLRASVKKLVGVVTGSTEGDVDHHEVEAVEAIPLQTKKSKTLNSSAAA